VEQVSTDNTNGRSQAKLRVLSPTQRRLLKVKECTEGTHRWEQRHVWACILWSDVRTRIDHKTSYAQWSV